MPMKKEKKDDANEDAESVASNSSMGTGSRGASKRGRQSLNKSVSGSTEQLMQTSTKSTIDLIKEFMDVIKNCRNNNGRLIHEIFNRLPTKRSNADYYESIKQPIDLIKIQQKIKSDEYETFQQFDDDILLLLGNAIQYYDKDTLEYKDASELKEAYSLAKSKKFDSTPMDLDESTSKPSSKRTVKKEKIEEDEAEDESEDDGSKSDPAQKRKSIRGTKGNKSPMKRATGDLNTSRRRTIDNLNNSVNSEGSDSAKVPKKALAATTKIANLDIHLEDFFDAICSHQDDTQRYLANVFYLLPEAKDYPDYYEIIKEPMDMKNISRKILSNSYNSLKEMESDLLLMLDNAKRYNDPKSIIYKDACKLKNLSKGLCKQIAALAGQAKFLDTSKTREQKKKILEDIAQISDHEEFQKLLEKNFENSKLSVKKETVVAAVNEEDDDDDEDDSDDGEETELDTTKTKGPKRAIDPVSKQLWKSMWSVFDHIKDFKLAGRPLGDPFVKLPSKVLYPDYYEDIKQPMALNNIKKKLMKRLYSTAREFFDEFEIIFKNAMQYNLESSLIYKDAQLLLDELNTKRTETSPMINTVVASPKVTTALTPSKLKLKKEKQDPVRATPIKAPVLNQSIPKFNTLKEKLLYLYNYLNDYQHEGRDLAPPFRLLPSKVEYPDYYSVIKKPIDMNKIMNKINQIKHTEVYNSIDDMCLDFAQMFENACIYNEPASVIYKDALNLQRALFTKRDELMRTTGVTTSQGCFSKDPVNEYMREVEFIKTNGYITNDFVGNAVQCLLQYLFEQTMQFQDMEGRTLSESFLDLYSAFELQSNPNVRILTFNMIRQRLYSGVYKRMDAFQDEIFQVFNQVRVNSYLGDSTVEGATFDKRIHRYSQLFKDAYELQRYFIQKRDEVCSNGERLQTNAMSFKTTSLDQYITAITNTQAAHNCDELEILAEDRFKQLQIVLSSSVVSTPELKSLQVGNFYYLDRQLVKSLLKDQYVPTQETASTKPLIGLVLATNDTNNQFIFQIYLQKEDTEFFDQRTLHTRRYYEQEVFKTDLYALIDSSHLSNAKQCIVTGIKEYIASEFTLASDVSSSFAPSDIFVCESIYSTRFVLFRKIYAKKWTPLAFIGVHTSTSLPESVSVSKRSLPLLINRQFINQQFVADLVTRVDGKLVGTNFAPMYCETVAFDTVPAATHKDDNDYETATVDDAELTKNATYYEQVLYKDGELYKLGDYVYVKDEKNNNETSDKLPWIVRIDRLWSNKAENSDVNFYFRGALFLHPTDIQHEPTRLFYKNEVFKEISREVVKPLDHVTMNKLTMRKKCSVMSIKNFVTDRVTEIDERDCYVCETKYSMQLKTFRKFTKGLKKFELSVKCNEDEVYFLRAEIQIHKQLSPVLVGLYINYDEELPAYEEPQDENDDENEDDWSDSGEPNLHDENSSTSFISNHVSGNYPIDTNSPIPAHVLKHQQQQLRLQSLQKHGKKVRVKRLKKCGYNIFSKEFRKSLRDTKSSLSFIDMSKEVGNRWRALSDRQRADYEEKARLETIIESQKMAAEEAEKQKQQALQQQQQPQQQPQAHMNTYNPNQSNFMPQQNVMVLSPQTNGQTIQVVNNQMYLNSNNNIINTASPQQVVYLNQSQQVMNGRQPIQLQPNQYVITNPTDTVQQPAPEPQGPKQVQHKEAYIKYIANMRKMEKMHSQPPSHVPNQIHIMPDWYHSLDIRSSRIKESKVLQPPNSWIENVPSTEVMQHLLSLRYNLLSDSVNVYKSSELCYEPEESKSNEENQTPMEPEYTQMETCQSL